MKDPKKLKIHFLLTGGTIDSFWNGAQDTVTVSKHSSIPEYINGIKLYADIEFTEVCMKDSRAITNEDREDLLKAIQESPAEKIIITHGTYTMPDTARYLDERLPNTEKTIVLTGSMTPLNGFDFSDAPFNLGYAISAVQALSTGVHVCMNGRHFTPAEVAKDVTQGVFYSIFSDKQ